VAKAGLVRAKAKKNAPKQANRLMVLAPRRLEKRPG
jgi:hypothetical protein